mmetsp:Transcript_12598/g.38181  ORF Transcript_12598/g.38181 Transcript_12598/m.38181 type:complete len:106 (-) Transcript_12598:44-361(-)|eukprot:CAMPEP_0177653562 /NCGR_PEP_ID=MMETSP0447-20121125/13807_1 /TAXON_ID=0 /ORGANISM="Stygamoeba regulata, Strain BSH-02190019" /LENGTH=105 /DNA_ID=CAMNT_0019157037 /DNA_START=45 /DNA_END=362 /DNA_ORIENTATION=-
MAFVNRLTPAVRQVAGTSVRQYASAAGADGASTMWKNMSFAGFGFATLWWAKVMFVDEEHAHGWPRQFAYMNLQNKDFPWGPGDVPLFSNLFPNWSPKASDFEDH